MEIDYLTYFFLSTSLLVLWRTKSYRLSLSFLILGELIAVAVAKAPALFPVSIFIAFLFMSRLEINDGIITTKSTILFGLTGTSVAVFISFIFSQMGLGYFSSISLALGPLYFAVSFLPRNVREPAMRLWKTSLALLAPLAIFEAEPSTISIPPMIIHYTITVFWIKKDFPDIVK